MSTPSTKQFLAVTEDNFSTVLIVTALDLETRAVLRHVDRGWTTQVDGQGTVYYRGRFKDWDVVVVEAGPGNASAAILAGVAAAQLCPEISLFVGVAGGIKDVKLGDVVVASKLYGYESGKDTTGGLMARPDLARSAHTLTQRARAMRKRNEWRKRLKLAVLGAKPNLLVEPVAAGEKVVASQRSATAKWIKEQYSDAVAVEMEGRGFLEAAHVHSTVATVIRGISDLLSKKAAADKKGWQKRARRRRERSRLRNASPVALGPTFSSPEKAAAATDQRASKGQIWGDKETETKALK